MVSRWYYSAPNGVTVGFQLIEINISKESNSLIRSTMRLIKRLMHRVGHSFFLFGLLSILWFLFRTGTKPTRISYPCQQASAANSGLWLTSYVLPLVLVKPSLTIQGIKCRSVILSRALALIGLIAICFNKYIQYYGQCSGCFYSPGKLR